MTLTSRLALLLTGTIGALLGGAGTHWWQARQGPSAAQVSAWLAAHPEAAVRQDNPAELRHLAVLAARARQPWPGAVLGNPDGHVTLVEFTDYNCGYCARSVADVFKLIAANPDLKVVVRELPILAPESRKAAKMALVAAEQGRFAGFYRAMFAADRVDSHTIAAAAQAAGVDMAAARKALSDPRLDAELDHNIAMARDMGFGGTPSWVAGNALIGGAVGVGELAKALAASAPAGSR